MEQSINLIDEVDNFMNEKNKTVFEIKKNPDWLYDLALLIDLTYPSDTLTMRLQEKDRLDKSGSMWT